MSSAEELVPGPVIDKEKKKVKITF